MSRPLTSPCRLTTDRPVKVHGLDYNGNGRYDFAWAGRSELDPTLPAEATDPVACGILRVKDVGLPTP